MSWHIPIKTAWMKEQSEHLPSMEYAKDIHKVASRMPKDFIALEIGMAWGFSTLAILEAGAKHLTSVDPNILAKGSEEAIANGYGDKHVWTVQRSKQFWAENPSVEYDLVYVDGSHLYDDVYNDLFQAWARLNKGGMLLIDDWDHKKNIQSENNTTEYGVSLACFEFWKDKVSEIKGVGIDGRVLWFKK